MPAKYQRGTYTPTSIVYDKTSIAPFELADPLGASYLDLQESVKEYKTYVVTSTDEGLPDKAAYQFYGTSELWWVICVYNGIIEPLEEYRVGLVVKIPTIDITSFLRTNSSNSSMNPLGSTRRL